LGKTRNCLIILCLVLFVVGTASAAAPVAQFTGTPINGPLPLTVTFTDTSTGSPTGWAWYFGDETYKASWTQMTASAGWTRRRSSVVMPGGSIVLMGGWGQHGNEKDVWRSTDKGATWTQMTASAGWTARYGHTSVAMPDGSIVLMGGISTGNKNDVWRSTDNGATWTQITADAVWSARYFHNSVAMPDGSIVLMGGYDGSKYKNDVWRLMPAGSSAKNPSHTYTTPGIYTVALQVYNTKGYNSIRKIGYITVTGPSKIGVFRSSTWQFLLDSNGNGKWDGAVIDRAYVLGMTGSVPVTGDWNNDGKTEIGSYQPGIKGIWRLDYNGNGKWDGAVIDRAYVLGTIGSVPVTGDWNNDGKTEIGYYQPGTKGIWYLDYNGNGIWNGGVTDRAYIFGTTGSVPVTGDWNNDGKTEIGYYQPGTSGVWYLDYNGNGKWNGGVTDRTYVFGTTGSVPVTGDWNNDETTEIGYYQPGTSGVWRLDYNGNGKWNGGVIDRAYVFGLSTDTPISGKW
jgi:PKD repeat protein